MTPRSRPSPVASLLGGAALMGAIVGIAASGRVAEAPARLAVVAGDVGAAAGLARVRVPQAGDRWGGCNDARTAGTAPIYRGEPGYRDDMDGDGDGIACESRPDP